MTWKALFCSATVFAALTLAMHAPAEARHHHGGRAFFAGGSPHHSFFRHHRFHRHRFAFVGVYPYAYGDGCYWLKRRAIHTGSRYWWRRYFACRHGYY
jgi:hypothetical protein